MNTVLSYSGMLSQLLRKRRKTLGLSQAALGLKLGLSQERIANIEAAPGKVNFDQVLQILQSLELELNLAELPRVVTATGHARGSSSAQGVGIAKTPAKKGEIDW